MKKSIRRNNPGLRFLLQYWQRYCTLEPWHTDWAKQHIRVLNGLRKKETLYLDGQKQKQVYLVVRGLLARVQHDQDKRQILSVAQPGMGMMTTDHLYSRTPSMGHIVVLRSASLVIQIPYSAILEFKEREPHINTLINVLGNKKRKQMMKLRIMGSITKSVRRYAWFADHLPKLRLLLTQQEMAELLGMSKTSVKRANKKWINGRNTR